MAYRRTLPFDPARDFETATFFPVDGTYYERGKPFDKGSVDARTLKLLYETYKIVYRDASDAEQKDELAPVTLESAGGGWWAIGAPWLDEAIKIQGQDPAKLRATQLRDEGEPNDHHGVVMLPGDNGWWTIAAEWMEAPEKVQGDDAAHARANEIRKAGPPKEADATAAAAGAGGEAGAEGAGGTGGAETAPGAAGTADQVQKPATNKAADAKAGAGGAA